MATQTHYLTNTLVGGWQSMSTTTPGADAYASPVTGWIVGSTAPGSLLYSSFAPAAERLESTFAATAQPDGTLDTSLKDALYIDPGGGGDYASGNWTVNGVVRANTNGGAQDGRLRYRLFKADADGTNATEITAAAQLGATLTNVSNAADFNSSVTFNPGAFSVTASQKLFLQLAWERTGAGGMTTADINFRIGTNSTRVVTADFTAGSTAYTADVSETVSLSESASAAFDAITSPSESVGAVTEAVTGAYGAVASPAETVAHAESLASQWTTSPSAAETVGLDESLAAGLLLSADVSESVGAIGEVASAGYEARPVPQETVGISESASTTFAAIAAPSESVALSETAAAGMGSSANVAESLGSISENSGVGYSAAVAPSESVTVAESVEGTQSGGGGTSYTAEVGESVSLADALGSTLTTEAQVADTVALTEQVSADGLVPIYDLATSTVVASPDGQSSIVSTGGRAAITSIDATAIIEEN
jgi:hypothetical protein